MIFYRAFPPESNRAHILSRAYGTFFRIDEILEHKISLGKFKKIDIVSSISSNQNAMQLEMNSKGGKNLQKTNTWRLNNMLLNNLLITEDIKKVVKRY